jgi:hypothetical protein
MMSQWSPARAVPHICHLQLYTPRILLAKLDAPGSGCSRHGNLHLPHARGELEQLPDVPVELRCAM